MTRKKRVLWIIAGVLAGAALLFSATGFVVGWFRQELEEFRQEVKERGYLWEEWNWTYDKLPNGFYLERFGSVRLNLCGAPMCEVGGYVTAVAWDERYLCAVRPAGSLEWHSRADMDLRVMEYFLIDTEEARRTGPLEEEEFLVLYRDTTGKDAPEWVSTEMLYNQTA